MGKWVVAELRSLFERCIANVEIPRTVISFFRLCSVQRFPTGSKGHCMLHHIEA